MFIIYSKQFLSPLFRPLAVSRLTSGMLERMTILSSTSPSMSMVKVDLKEGKGVVVLDHMKCEFSLKRTYVPEAGFIPAGECLSGPGGLEVTDGPEGLLAILADLLGAVEATQLVVQDAVVVDGEHVLRTLIMDGWRSSEVWHSGFAA